MTKNGLAIRFLEEDVRRHGTYGYGVKGVNLGKDDDVIAMDIVEENADLLVISEKALEENSSRRI